MRKSEPEVTRNRAVPISVRFFGRAAILPLLLCFAEFARAGGPEYVAGSSYFDSSTTGQPVVWSLGEVIYYTDQGDLSPILPNEIANAFVGTAFNQWTSVPSAAITVLNGGQLAENVSGSNIAADLNGTVTAPADITSSATQKPVGIVYDYDGTVTDALLGAGAGDPSDCFWNAAYGGVDNFGTEANFLHALVIINGQCAQQSSQLTDVQYRLVRVLGNVLGLGWSQLNLNVMSGSPTPTSDDYHGFPVMHFMDPVSCVPITVCYPNPYQLAPDDMAVLSRLYPSLTGNPNTTARIHGSIYFVNHMDVAAQPMQGVNVVAQWINPSTNLPSHRYAASSVSGFLFTGNAGNPITGWNDPLGNPYSEFGSSDQMVEGFFDLGGLPIPNGASTAQYLLTVEGLDPTWSAGVGPYVDSQIPPSGTMPGNPPGINVTVSAGGDLEQDILMSGSSQPVPPWAATETWSSPALVPSPGDWVGSLSGYGDVAYFQIAAQANRTLSVAVTALDENGAPTESKTEPVVGIWTLGDAHGAAPPTLTPAPFNSGTFGMSRLDAQVLASNSFIIGIADLRGDGRPDYHYHAHVLYGDSVIPPRLAVNGGVIALNGTGFAPGLVVMVGATSVPLIATNASQMLVAAPAQSNDGPQTITITDPVSGAFSVMTDALTFGAAATDSIVLLQGGNPPTPVGAQGANPVIVRVFASDAITTVSGATVGWTATNGVSFSACSSGPGCSSFTDESGIASTRVTPGNPGVATIMATLAPGAYASSPSVTATLFATTPLAVAVTTPYLWIAQGATVSVPLMARVLNAGIPQTGVAVNFTIPQGAGSLSASSATTNGSGYASVTLTVTNFTGSVQLAACAVEGTNPCTSIYGNAVAATKLNLQAVAGAGQVITGSAFLPLQVRVTDSSIPPNPVLGASVLFQSTVLRPAGNNLILPGDPGSAPPEMPVILSSSQSSIQSNADGLASILPAVGLFSGPLEVEIQVSAGATASLQDELEIYPATDSGNTSSPTSSLWNGDIPAGGR